MTRKTFLTLVAAHSATIDAISETDGTLVLDAPTGHVWNSNGCHCIVEPFENRGGQSWKAQAYADAVKRMSMGVNKCENAECDVCEANR